VFNRRAVRPAEEVIGEAVVVADRRLLERRQGDRLTEAPIRMRQDDQLVTKGEHLEQEVSTRRQGESDRSEGPGDVLHRA
jgi:hypothetical protein